MSIAEGMLDGTFCTSCGEFIGETLGFPTICAACNAESVGRARKTKADKIGCPWCSRRVNGPQGLTDHARNAHGFVVTVTKVKT